MGDMKKSFYLVLAVLLQGFVALAANAFIVEHIRFEGLQRVTPATAESYLPIKRGQDLTQSKTSSVLRSLYKTGFFDHIELTRDGDVLVVHVVERPTIGQLKISGNTVVPTDKLQSVMKSLDMVEGRVYNPEVIEKITKSLLNQYYQLGRYNARIDVAATPMSRNRVFVNVKISEGLIAKVRRITILGNTVFDEATLVKQLDLSSPSIFSFVTQKDRYSESKMDVSLEKLRSYYMDRGYLRFEVKSSQVQITPDRKSVYITISVKEGQPFTVREVEVSGKTIIPRSKLRRLILIQPGDTFSREKVIQAQKAISKELGANGYMFANVSLRPQVNDKTHQVVLKFVVVPGRRVYVRHVTFSENNRTNDVVLRREILQWESAPASTSKLEDSKQRLTLLPFIREVDMTVTPVPGSQDEVDVNYKIKEDNSATATFKVGYSQIDRVIVGLGFNQKNFLGTGNTLGVNLSRSKYQQFYGIDYTDPYYTEDGISRTLNLSASRVDPRGGGVNNGYTTNDYSAGMTFGFPIGQEDKVINRFIAGGIYQDTLVYLIPGRGVSNQINSYVTSHGTHFQEIDFRIGASRDGRDKAIFPTRGVFQTLFFDGYVPVAPNSVTFGTLSYQAKWYLPLTDEFIFLTHADAGYGTGLHGTKDYPFFKNMYAGGIGSVRGYQGYTLGPRDSNGKPFGGNALIDGSIALIFPNHLSDNLRTSVFVDAGNVYTTQGNRAFGGQSAGSGPVRFSTGVEADWLSPFGPVKLSLARALNRQQHPSDQLEAFQFDMSSNF